MVLAPLSGDAGRDPIGRLWSALAFGVPHGEVVGRGAESLVVLLSLLSEGVEVLTVHGGEVGRRHGGGDVACDCLLI